MGSWQCSSVVELVCTKCLLCAKFWVPFPAVLPPCPQSHCLMNTLSFYFSHFFDKWRASLFLVPCLIAVMKNPDKINPGERTIPFNSQLQDAGCHHRELKAAGAWLRQMPYYDGSQKRASAWCTFSVLSILFTYLLFMCRYACTHACAYM